MVGYQTFVSLVFDVARDRGRSIDTLEESQEVLTVASELWSEGKPSITSASEAEARQFIEENA
jgi:hypothetical protein